MQMVLLPKSIPKTLFNTFYFLAEYYCFLAKREFDARRTLPIVHHFDEARFLSATF